jgi:prepilin-type N-terminal cleavage/methylation domain-containing protein
MDNILHTFANNTNTKKRYPPHQQVYANKQHVDKQRINSQHGFTIIEVALVLAIAGLIFLVVFSITCITE